MEANRYKLTDPEELNEYMWLKTSLTHLDVDLFVDDGHSYERHSHDLLLFVRNGHGRECHSFIPFSISGNLGILDDDTPVALPSDTISMIQHFIKSNQDILKALATEQITQEHFVQQIQNTIPHPS